MRLKNKEGTSRKVKGESRKLRSLGVATLFSFYLFTLCCISAGKP
jgi:hypothetical protein